MLGVNDVLDSAKMPVFDFEQPGGSKAWTPLHVACYTGSFEVIEELIERAGVDIFSRSLNNKLPRQVARNTIVAKILRLAERRVIESQLGLAHTGSQSSKSTHDPPKNTSTAPKPRQRPAHVPQQEKISEQQFELKLLIASQKEWSRHSYRIGERNLLY